jgi:hypothetical protein
MASKKKPDKKKSGPCPVGCKKINLKMDCSDHPDGLPFPERQKPNGWKVKPGPRCGVNKTNKMHTMIEDAYSEETGKQLPPGIQKWVKQQYGIEAKYGEELLSAMKMANLKPQIHHKLPIMLGGDDSVGNYIPLAKKDHQYAYGGIHKWWDEKLRGMENDLESKLGKCDKKSKNKKERELHNCARRKDGNMKKTCEGQLTKIAGCLEKQGVKLYADCKQ